MPCKHVVVWDQTMQLCNKGIVNIRETFHVTRSTYDGSRLKQENVNGCPLGICYLILYLKMHTFRLWC